MVRLAALPEQAIIDQYKGYIDFYLWRGIPCARKWPVHRPRWRSPAELQTQANFTLAVKLWNDLPPKLRNAYNQQAKATPLTGRDLFIRGFITGLKY